MESKRKETRKKLLKFTTVYDLRTKLLLGFVGDLTMKGALVSGEKSVEAGTHIILGIEFPESPSSMSPVRVVLPSRVAWCRHDPDNPQDYNIGFEFTEVSEENAIIIKAILERYQFRPALDASDLES